MKLKLLALFVFSASLLQAQSDTLVSAVYSLDSIKNKNANAAIKPELKGSTTDLLMFSYHASTLQPGKTNHPLRALMDREEVIVVKDGELKIFINDSSKILGPGSIALIIAGDQQSFQNISDKPATYYVLGFKSKLPVNIDRGKTGGGSYIQDWKNLTIKKTPKGESRAVFDRPSSMFERFEIHATALNAGEISHPPHTHKAEEIMLVMKGNVTMNIDSTFHKAGAGDLILMRPNIPHNLTNTGNEQCWYYAIKWYNLKEE